jgi:predicted site-specific integrase-resolvase
MNPEQIKDEIRNMNQFEIISLYRWINDEVARCPRIGADRSLEIREEIERICEFPFERGILYFRVSARPTCDC